MANQESNYPILEGLIDVRKGVGLVGLDHYRPFITDSSQEQFVLNGKTTAGKSRAKEQINALARATRGRRSYIDYSMDRFISISTAELWSPQFDRHLYIVLNALLKRSRILTDVSASGGNRGVNVTERMIIEHKGTTTGLYMLYNPLYLASRMAFFLMVNDPKIPVEEYRDRLATSGVDLTTYPTTDDLTLMGTRFKEHIRRTGPPQFASDTDGQHLELWNNLHQGDSKRVRLLDELYQDGIELPRSYQPAFLREHYYTICQLFGLPI